MSMPSSYDLAKVIHNLLTIAKVAMPEHLQAIDPRVQTAQRLLEVLNPNQHRPPSISPLPSPAPFIGEADPSDPMAHEVLAKLDASPGAEFDIEAALSTFLAEEGAPATHREAMQYILRDWLVGHGYLGHHSAGDPYH